jgi:dihydrofolate reductase
MIISGIVAVAENNAIGKNNQLPWHLPEDLKFFKRTTIGKPVIMGRKTYESLGKPLPGRLNIVISSQNHLPVAEGVMVYNDIQAALDKAETDNEEIFIIGGGKIFEETLAEINRLYITVVKTTVPDADAFFPHLDHTHWKLVWHEDHQADDKHIYDYTFQHWERINQI